MYFLLKQIRRQNKKVDLVSASKVPVYHVQNVGRVCLRHQILMSTLAYI